MILKSIILSGPSKRIVLPAEADKVNVDGYSEVLSEFIDEIREKDWHYLEQPVGQSINFFFSDDSSVRAMSSAWKKFLKNNK